MLVEKISKAEFLFKLFLRYWRRNYGSTRKPIWKSLCTYVRCGNKYNYDLHYLDPFSSKDGLDSVAFYVSKYLLKYDEFVEKFRSKLYFTFIDDKTGKFRDAWSKFRPRILLSKGFGSPDDPKVQEHIIKGINFALSDPNALFAYYISAHNGSTYPLAPYYSNRFVSSESQLIFCLRRPEFDDIKPSDYDDYDKAQFRLGLTKSFLRSKSSAFDFDDIEDINNFNLPDYGFEKSNFDHSVFASDWEDF